VSLALAAPAQAQTERTVKDTLPIDSGGEVSVENHDGAIQVETWDRSEVQYEARIVNEASEEFSQTVEQTRIRAESAGSRVKIVSDFEDVEKVEGFLGWSESRKVPAVYYTIKIPSDASLRIDDHESTITVSSIQGSLHIDTHDGDIDVTDQGGDVTIDTHDGDMRLTNVRGAVEVDTHDGELYVTGLTGGLRFESHDGSADVEWAEVTSDVYVDTHDGSASLTFPAGTAFTLDVDTGDGDLDLDSSIDDLRIDDGTVMGEINGGGPRVTFEAHDGDLTIEMK
jgi:hypothetical protein